MKSMKISVPINIKTLSAESLPKYYGQIKACGAQRVYICSLSQIACPSDSIRQNPKRLSEAIRFFKDRGLEVGVWLGALGHGRPLYSDAEGGELTVYQPIVGLDGGSTPYGICPLCEKFVKDYTDGLKLVASLGPDIIMLDDDLRFNRGAKYYMGCFCDRHMSIYEKKIGEKMSRSQLAELIFSGGKNKYRDAFMDMLGESILEFCARLREAVDTVDPSIRIGACSVRESIDYDGIDPEMIARALAGKTKPFTRMSGAPYGGDVIGPAEFIRLQLTSLFGSGVETLTEGDTYPRPRYNLPYNLLRLYNLIIIADGRCDTRLDYLFDYNHRPEYDPSYAERYARDIPKFKRIEELFSGASADGIYVYDNPKKLRNWELPETVDPDLVRRLPVMAENPAASLLSKCSVPTAFEPTDYPAAVFGENARGIDRAVLKNGAILDAVSARILSDAGIDTGILSYERVSPACEYFIGERDGTVNVDTGANLGMRAKPSAKAHSVYLCNTESADISGRAAGGEDIASDELCSYPLASYSYKNEAGERFLVLGADLYLSNDTQNLTRSFYREAQIKRWIEEGGKRLPVLALGAPSLYAYTARKGGSLCVLLVNAFADEIPEMKIKLDGEYSAIEFINGSGELKKDEVTVSEIPPYGYAVFELKN